ncbi:hypothetical protein QAD02_015858 [Eretmocerus hayati]|uniref:Uncharacterized protein n=1 Tax=Eretmocerus hayati TaxID=131215 RepID=A0ACC2PAP8_9HYME|nr:hypothetical protein QAD02_015858 [Eretmocerus hayati]
MILQLLLTVLAINTELVSGEAELETVFQWRYLDYVWPSKEHREEAIRKGTYIISNPIPMDVDVAKDGRVFITSLGIPGVPARLGVVSNLMSPSGPLIQPYPNWNWTDRNDCDSIIEVYRVAIDKCNRLWVLDSAVLMEGESRNCQPKLLAFDLKTDTLITKIVIPEHIATGYTNDSLFANVIVETEGSKCEKTTVYMADSRGMGLVIWDGTQLYRFHSTFFDPQPNALYVSVGNDTSKPPIGLVGINISPKTFPNQTQKLYLRPLASRDLFHVDINSVKKEKTKGSRITIHGAKNILSSQAVGQVFSPKGVLFLGLTKECAIACWNQHRELKRENIEIVARDDSRLQYTGGMKVLPSRSLPDGELWLISNRFTHNYILKKFDKTQINYRVMRTPVDKLIAGTKCEIPKNLQEAMKKVQ